MELSSSESEGSDHGDSDDWGNNESKKPKEKKLIKNRKKPTPSNSQPEDERGSKSPDSGHGSDDNEKSKPTSPLSSVPKAGKPQVPTKPPNLRVSPQASPPAEVKNVDPVNSEVQKPSSLFDQKVKLFDKKADKCQLQSVIDQGKRK